MTSAQDFHHLVGMAKRLKSAGEAPPPGSVAVLTMAIDAMLAEATKARPIEAPMSAEVSALVSGMLATATRNFVAKFTPAEADEETRQAAQRFGTVAAIGELAIRLGVLPWETSEAYKAAGSMLGAWLGGGTPPATQSPASVMIARAPIEGEAAEPVSNPLAAVIDRLGRPPAVTLAQIAADAETSGAAELHASLTDRRTRRSLPQRLAECGYEQASNADARDGLWKVGPARMVVYARADLGEQDRAAAARELAATRAGQ